jgi:hypothetical protein
MKDALLCGLIGAGIQRSLAPACSKRKPAITASACTTS